MAHKTPKYNPPTANSWYFSLILLIVSMLIELMISFKLISGPIEMISYPLVMLSSIWLIMSTKLKGL